MDIQKILIEALKLRNIFHSEADFQHHFAWAIQNAYKSAEIRLEYPLSKNIKSKWEYCDIILRAPEKIGIELKYKTKLMHREIDGETFELKSQGAQDVGRYDFLKDITRLENWLERGNISSGYAIMLSNDKSYWLTPNNKSTFDSEFKIHNRTVSGKLSWGSKASVGTMQGRESAIMLKNKYNLKWVDSELSEFKYLLVEVKC